ncbi:DUF1858 domain-containing protein [Candidatus Dojkabacteria bacterium]|nr:DUF1858 domain-containing protein [Candidatus Dojkabacteria bacterium]
MSNQTRSRDTEMDEKNAQLSAGSDISGDILVSDLVASYPEVTNFLVFEYGLHCMTCFLAGYETLEEGAAVHGIKGKEFMLMISHINQIISGEKRYDPDKGLIDT